jgi:hypothetical protein
VEELPALFQQLRGGTSGNTFYSCVEELQVLSQQLRWRNIIRPIVEPEKKKERKVKLSP